MYGNDQYIRDYVDRTFQMYDFDRSGGLDFDELTIYLHEWYGNMGYNVALTPQHVQGVMLNMDYEIKGFVTKEELFVYLKNLWSQPQHPPQQQNFQMPQQHPQVIIVKGKNVQW